MRDAIDERFRDNLDRVRGLIAICEQSADSEAPTATDLSDVLRAAIVFLHATLEDVVRSVVEWRLPHCDAEALDGVPLQGEPSPKLTLAQLSRHRGAMVDDVIRASVIAHLEKSNYNDPSQVVAALQRVGLDPHRLGPHLGLVATMMKRRHWIVHRADRDVDPRRRTHAARPIDKSFVHQMMNAVDSLCTAVIDQLPSTSETEGDV